MSAPAESSAGTGNALSGRSFVSPLFDLLVIGGGLSLLVVGPLLFMRSQLGTRVPLEFTLPLVLLTTTAHFAASTIRLYTKPGSFQSLPIMTMGFPLIAFVVPLVALMWPELFGRNLYVLYLTWSPYHYAAQTFGLTSMYTSRAGGSLPPLGRKLLWWTCMLPFMHSFTYGASVGLGWFLPPTFLVDHPLLITIKDALWLLTGIGALVVPLALLGVVRTKMDRRLPLIVPCLLVSNAVWWVFLPYLEAFFWATIFHGLQYISIVLVFHLKDHPPTGTGAMAWAWPSLKFYAACLGLGYVLFEVWPYFYTWLGFSFSESVLVCVAVVNIHHFVVDRGIWQIRKDAGNRKVVQT